MNNKVKSKVKILNKTKENIYYKWFPKSDPPPYDKRVIVKIKNISQPLIGYRGYTDSEDDYWFLNQYTFSLNCYGPVPRINVTHWTHLPKNPK